MKTQTDWDNHCTQLFVQLNDNADFDKTSAKIKNLPTPYIKEWKEEILLQPLDKLHLYSEFKGGKAVSGGIRFVWLFGIIGVFVLLLACINFMNLSTARSEKRAKEVGIRKTIGSLRTQIIWQFLSESVVVAFLAFILAIVMVQLSLPFFNSLADKQMSIVWNSPSFWFLSVGFTLFTGIIAGSYPAFYLSAFEPIKVLKGNIPRRSPGIVSTQNAGSGTIYSIYCFNHRHYHCFPPDTICKRQAGGLYKARPYYGSAFIRLVRAL
jgi:ABC-type antimicrobial peptide transport system permease subunit